MSRFLGGFFVLLWIVMPLTAQEIEHTFSLTTEAGYLTNANLDPVIPVWERAARAPFLGFTPSFELDWIGVRDEASIRGHGRYAVFEGDESNWWLGGLQALYRHNFSSATAIGVNGGGSYLNVNWRQAYGWGTAFLQWNVLSSVRLRVMGGGSTRQVAATDSSASWNQSSLFSMLTSEFWLSSRWVAGLSVYGSRTPETGTHGYGAALNAWYRVSRNVQFMGELGIDEFSYAGAIEGLRAPTDRTWQGSGSLEWFVLGGLTLTSSVGVQQYKSSLSGDTFTDVYASTGFRYTIRGRRSLEEEVIPLWVQEGEGVRFQFPYNGKGKLYLVGDFNNWEEQNLLLEPGPGGLYTTRISVPPGTYQYKIQAWEGGALRWVPLPDHARTISDGFGGTNGILHVDNFQMEEDASS